MHKFMRYKPRLSGASGMSKLTLMILLAAFGTCVFLIHQILPFYYYYYELVNQMESLIAVAGSNTDKEIRQKLKQYMKEMQIPASIEDVEIIRRPGYMLMRLEYEEVFYITWNGEDIDLKVFPFVAQAEGKY